MASAYNAETYMNWSNGIIISTELFLRNESHPENKVSPMQVFDRGRRGREKGVYFKLTLIRPNAQKKADAFAVLLDPLQLPVIKSRLDAFDVTLVGAITGTGAYLPDNVTVYNSGVVLNGAKDFQTRQQNVAAGRLLVEYRFNEKLPWKITVQEGQATESTFVNGMADVDSWSMTREAAVILPEHEFPAIINHNRILYESFLMNGFPAMYNAATSGLSQSARSDAAM